MSNASIVLLMLACSSTAGAVTAGTDALEPVNVIAESGIDIGPCPGGGSLSYPPPAYKGSAYFLRKADTGFATRHDALTKQRAPWLHRLDGPSGSNRLFTAADGGRALVFWTCQPGTLRTARTASNPPSTHSESTRQASPVRSAAPRPCLPRQSPALKRTTTGCAARHLKS